MDIAGLLISLISGAVGGNVAGAAAPDKSLGALGNSISGLIGGGAGGLILQALGMGGATTGLDLSSLLSNVGSGGVSGAVVMLIVAIVKQYTDKK